MSKNTIPYKYHIVFWIGYFIFNSIRWGSYFNDYWYSLKSNLIEFPLHVIIVYFNIFYLVPRFIMAKRYGLYFFYLLLALFTHFYIRSGLEYWILSDNIWPEAFGLHEPFSFNHIINVSLGELYVIALVSAIKFMIDYIIQLNKNSELLQLQSSTELKYLKAQIQPHFFFNTLNNLYALTLQRSTRASDVVLQLSKIMEYIIYDVDKKKTPLLKEIEYIQNYVELEKIRYGDLIEFNIKIVGDIGRISVPPLLYLPFLENCFKHGGRNNKKIHIEVTFQTFGELLDFSISNNYDLKNINTSNSGIGIANTRRRLELLYGNIYKLKIDTIQNIYSVHLQIPIK